MDELNILREIMFITKKLMYNKIFHLQIEIRFSLTPEKIRGLYYLTLKILCMKKIKWLFVLAFALGVGSAFKSANVSRLDVEVYAVEDENSTFYFVLRDPSSSPSNPSPFLIPSMWEEGQDYFCDEAGTCTITIDEDDFELLEYDENNDRYTIPKSAAISFKVGTFSLTP